MFSVTPLPSGYTIELLERDEYSYRNVFVRNPAGEVALTLYFGAGESARAHKVYEIMVALATTPVSITESAVQADAA